MPIVPANVFCIHRSFVKYPGASSRAPCRGASRDGARGRGPARPETLPHTTLVSCMFIDRVVYPPLFLRFIIWMYPSFEPQSSPVFSVYFYRFFAFFYEEIEVEWPVCLPPRSTASGRLPISGSLSPNLSFPLTVDYCVLGARGRQPHSLQIRDWRILGSVT